MICDDSLYRMLLLQISRSLLHWIDSLSITIFDNNVICCFVLSLYQNSIELLTFFLSYSTRVFENSFAWIAKLSNKCFNSLRIMWYFKITIMFLNHSFNINWSLLFINWNTKKTMLISRIASIFEKFSKVKFLRASNVWSWFYAKKEIFTSSNLMRKNEESKIWKMTLAQTFSTRLIATSQELEKYQEFDLKKSNQILKVKLEACFDVKFKFLILASSSNSNRKFRLEAWLDIKSNFRLKLEAWFEQLENIQIWSKYYVLRKSNAKR